MYPDSTELMHFCCSEHLAKYSVETASQHLQAQTVQHGALFQTTRQRQQERQKRPEKRTGRTEGEKTTHQEEKQNREKTERKRRQEKKEEGKEGEEEAEGEGRGKRRGRKGRAKGGRREGKKEEEEEEEKKKKAKKEEKGGEGRREERRREKRREAKKRKKRENKGDRLEPLNPSVPGRRKAELLGTLDKRRCLAMAASASARIRCFKVRHNSRTFDGSVSIRKSALACSTLRASTSSRHGGSRSAILHSAHLDPLAVENRISKNNKNMAKESVQATFQGFLTRARNKT